MFVGAWTSMWFLDANGASDLVLTSFSSLPSSSSSMKWLKKSLLGPSTIVDLEKGLPFASKTPNCKEPRLIASLVPKLVYRPSYSRSGKGFHLQAKPQTAKNPGHLIVDLERDSICKQNPKLQKPNLFLYALVEKLLRVSLLQGQ
ncbi:hypothetical protein FEM48_Zijuj04G0115500 [Ziziphus jujuba var. spinosa]|uniref:Uncharacterized protein n=1 Tax=Ziziphus jujuba var. spinosa TaxID=714518 RepID=A0A978VJM5_ZIZJJ|nr:hypothetical protein FEM48_Zijuj04G0115500 [Ziziphus jujuba var. spinosa]